GRSKLAAEIGQRLLEAIPVHGFGSVDDNSKEIKTKVDVFRDVGVMAFSLFSLYEGKLQAIIALEARDERSRGKLEETVQFLGGIMPYFFKGALDLDVSGVTPPASTDPNPNPMFPNPGQPNP